ncbi:MAG: HAD-IA family hydrolase [Thermoplasmata archaeon]|nr:HAD-IA family hydrolase [Thermoplasmata archaeon]
MPRQDRPSRLRLPPLVLFDLDDTIFDHTLTCRAALAELRRQERDLTGPSLDDTLSEYGRLLNAMHTDVMLGRRTADDVRAERFERLTEWAGHPVARARAEELSSTYRREYQRLRRAVPGAPEAIRRLAGRAKIGVVTNNTVAEQVEKLAFLRLDGDVDFLVTSEEVGRAKPDPAIFRAALERGKHAPRDAVMVGDSWASDVVGARAAGIRAVWFNRFETPPPAKPGAAELTSFRPLAQFERLISADRRH